MDLSPLAGIRLRTPRLELRLPTADDVIELYRVAEEGIHPADEMPFGHAWTDTLNEADFVAYYDEQGATWSAESWNATFVTACEGRIIGTQDLHGRDFGRTREVGSGSWLGRAWQGHGLGTEQRAAVLELAFRGLGARAAVTGALWHNRASQRVTEKLGYTLVGESTLTPRGEPVRHFDYRLEAKDWRCPLPIEIVGLEPALHLFGVS